MTDYRKKYSEPKIEEVNDESVKEVKELQEELIETETEADESEEVTEQKSEPVYGVVRNCEKLNVRKYPSSFADVVCILNEGTELRVDEAQSTDDWYNVTHASGIEGFCMKQFVAVSK